MCLVKMRGLAEERFVLIEESGFWFRVWFIEDYQLIFDF